MSKHILWCNSSGFWFIRRTLWLRSPVICGAIFTLKSHKFILQCLHLVSRAPLELSSPNYCGWFRFCNSKGPCLTFPAGRAIYGMFTSSRFYKRHCCTPRPWPNLLLTTGRAQPPIYWQPPARSSLNKIILFESESIFVTRRHMTNCRRLNDCCKHYSLYRIIINIIIIITDNDDTDDVFKSWGI